MNGTLRSSFNIFIMILQMLTCLQFPVECTLWPTTGLRRASVSSYGYGGSNAHVVLDDAYNYLQLRGLIGNHVSAKDLPSLSTHSASHLSADVETENTAEDGTTFEPKILVWSAADNNGLKRVSEAYQDHICKLNYQRQDGEYFSDLAYTLACKRSFLPWRGFIVARSVDELGKTLEQSSLDPTRSTHIPALCFIFTGQGAQWPSMADDLLAYPLFKRSLEDADAYFHDLGCTWSLLGNPILPNLYYTLIIVS